MVPVTGAMLDASRLLDRDALAPLLDAGGGANSDYYPVLDIGAERARYLRQRAAGLAELAVARFDFVAALRRSRQGFGTDTVVVVADAPRQRAQAIAAAVRIPSEPAREARSDALSQARHLLTRWTAQSEGGRPPADWRAWLAEFDAAERVVHGAARGMADEGFYGRVTEFLRRAGAPDEVRDVVEFRRALAGWDFPLAKAAGGRLAATGVRERNLIPARDLLEGVVTANLIVGDPTAADSLLRLLLPRVQFANGDLRILLLAAYVEAAGGAAPSSVR